MRLRPLSGPAASAEFMGLQFQLPGHDEVFTASARRVRVDERGVALAFTHIAPGVRAAIESYLQAA